MLAVGLTILPQILWAVPALWNPVRMRRGTDTGIGLAGERVVGRYGLFRAPRLTQRETL